MVTVVDRGGMGVNNFDLSKPAFEQLAVSRTSNRGSDPTDSQSTDAGTIEVTWSWDNGFDPATGAQNQAGLAAVAIDGKVGGSSTSAAVAAVGTSVASTAAVESSPIATSTTALAAGADGVAPVDTSAVPVVSSAAATTSAESTAEPSGDRRGGRQSKRCAAQL